MASLIKRVEEFFEKHEKRISSFFLIGGFIFDNLTLQRVDKLFDHLIIISYLLVSGGSIALINYYKEHPPKRDFFVGVRDVLPFLMQFTIGGLFSAFLVFYVRSAALSSSWPFLAVLLFLLIGNEFFREYYHRLAFQVSIYFVAIFSFSILIVPVLLRKMNDATFILSGLVSLVIIYLFSRTLFKVVPTRYAESKTNLTTSIFSIFMIINMLYFFNLIPPIPLALKEAGVYHSIERLGGSYRVTGEAMSWYRSLPFFPSETLHLQAGDPLYLFSPVFAPTDLRVVVVHDWQYFDEEKGDWISSNKVSFSITGGRDEGYRGFSIKENIAAGKWRVDVKTERGQIIGRVRFNVEIVDYEPALKEKIL